MDPQVGPNWKGHRKRMMHVGGRINTCIELWRLREEPARKYQWRLEPTFIRHQLHVWIVEEWGTEMRTTRKATVSGTGQCCGQAEPSVGRCPQAPLRKEERKGIPSMRTARTGAWMRGACDHSRNCQAHRMESASGGWRCWKRREPKPTSRAPSWCVCTSSLYLSALKQTLEQASRGQKFPDLQWDTEPHP